MARIEFLLEDRRLTCVPSNSHTDQGSNNGSSALTCWPSLRLAKGIELLDVKSSTALVATQKHKELCEELTEILERLPYLDIRTISRAVGASADTNLAASSWAAWEQFFE